VSPLPWNVFGCHWHHWHTVLGGFLIFLRACRWFADACSILRMSLENHVLNSTPLRRGGKVEETLFCQRKSLFLSSGSLLWLNFGSLVNSCCPQLSDRIEVGFSFAWCCVAVLLYSMLAPPGRRRQCSRGGSNISVYVKSQERLDTGHTGLSWTDCRLWGTYL